MVEGNAAMGETDMPILMQQHAVSCASRALNLHDDDDCESIALFMKKEFDKCYGPGWQCVVGTKFGSFVSHTRGNFIYFGLERTAFLLFKAAACFAQ